MSNVNLLLNRRASHIKVALMSLHQDIRQVDVSYFTLDDQRWVLNRLYAIACLAGPQDMAQYQRYSVADQQLMTRFSLDTIKKCNKVWLDFIEKTCSVCSERHYTYSYAKMTINLLKLIDEGRDAVGLMAPHFGYTFEELDALPESPDGEPLVIEYDENDAELLDAIQYNRKVLSEIKARQQQK